MEFPVSKPPPVFLAQSANNTAGVRQAQLNFDFFHFKIKNGISKQHIVDASASTAVSRQSEVDRQDSSSSGTNDKVQSRTKLPITPKKKEPKPDQPQSASALTETLKTDTSFVSRLSLGGIRVAGAAAVSTDNTYTPSGFGRQDGIYFMQKAAFGDDWVGSLGLGIFNNLNTTTVGRKGIFQGWGAYSATALNFLGVLGVTSPTRSKAYVMTTNWSYNLDKSSFINAVVYYGLQNNAAVNTNGNGFATTTRDAHHFEASLLYNDRKKFGSEALVTGNGLAAWFEAELGSNQTKTSAGIDVPLPDLNDGYTSLLYGIGFGGDTRDYFSDLLFDADRLLYAITATYVQARFKDPAFSKGYNVTQFAVQMGYGYRTLEFNLVGSYAFSRSTAFADFKLDEPIKSSRDTRPNQTDVYLTATLYF